MLLDLRAGNDYLLREVTPFKPKTRNFVEIISELSPDFCEIYKQSMIAEQRGLNQISGMGYGKALEFLVKDLLVKDKKDKEAEIKAMPLSRCIQSYIDDTRIKECAQLATYLRNDETHYIRKWVDKDVEDLKVLIELTLRWIESVKLTEKYIAEMKKTSEE
jgi:hypothetical protein